MGVGGSEGLGFWGIFSPIRDIWLAEEPERRLYGGMRAGSISHLQDWQGSHDSHPDPSMMEVIYYYIVI